MEICYRIAKYLITEHHGRGSDRSFEFLDEIKPRFGILGCARAKHIAYDAWNTRKIDKIMQNQERKIVIYPKNDGNNKKSLFVYIENKRYAEDCGELSFQNIKIRMVIISTR